MFDKLREASELSHPGYGAWLFDTWESHNQQYFNGQLMVIPIIWGLTPHGQKLGLFDSYPRRITLHLSLLRPSGNAWGLRNILGVKFASDVLLHEMMHQSIFERTGGNGVPPGNTVYTSHNNPEWVLEINRIAPLLGLPANAALVRQKRVKEAGASGKGKVMWVAEDGCLSRSDLSTWPHLQRPKGYYEPDAIQLLDSYHP